MSIGMQLLELPPLVECPRLNEVKRRAYRNRGGKGLFRRGENQGPSRVSIQRLRRHSTNGWGRIPNAHPPLVECPRRNEVKRRAYRNRGGKGSTVEEVRIKSHPGSRYSGFAATRPADGLDTAASPPLDQRMVSIQRLRRHSTSGWAR
jgi:hypothetical protein